MQSPFLDFQKLLERMEDDRELILEIFTIFTEETPERAGKFKTALAGGDTKAMVLLAHSLKGASGTLHAEPLRQACYELEQAARAADKAKVAELTPQVLALLEKTSARMEEIMREMKG